MPNGFVYILRSLKDGRTYTGSTDNVVKRLKEHNAGRTFSTARRRPWTVIYIEECATLQEARRRERYLKTHAGRNKLKGILSDIIGE